MFIENWTDLYRFETIKFYCQSAMKDPKFWIYLACLAGIGFIGFIVSKKLMNNDK